MNTNYKFEKKKEAYAWFIDKESILGLRQKKLNLER